MLKARFSKKDGGLVSFFGIGLFWFLAKNGKDPTVLVSRLAKMCVAIKTIDSAQLPTDFALVGVLKRLFLFD